MSLILVESIGAGTVVSTGVGTDVSTGAGVDGVDDVPNNVLNPPTILVTLVNVLCTFVGEPGAIGEILLTGNGVTFLGFNITYNIMAPIPYNIIFLFFLFIIFFY